MQQVRIGVPRSFEAFQEPALARLGYLHPQVQWSFDAASTEIVGVLAADIELSEDELRREVLYQLYREKVQQETLPIRQQIYRAVSA